MAETEDRAERVSGVRKSAYLISVTRVTTYRVLVADDEDPIDVYLDAETEEDAPEVSTETVDMTAEPEVSE